MKSQFGPVYPPVAERAYYPWGTCAITKAAAEQDGWGLNPEGPHSPQPVATLVMPKVLPRILIASEPEALAIAPSKWYKADNGRTRVSYNPRDPASYGSSLTEDTAGEYLLKICPEFGVWCESALLKSATRQREAETRRFLRAMLIPGLGGFTLELASLERSQQGVLPQLAMTSAIATLFACVVGIGCHLESRRNKARMSQIWERQGRALGRQAARDLLASLTLRPPAKLETVEALTV